MQRALGLSVEVVLFTVLQDTIKFNVAICPGGKCQHAAAWGPVHGAGAVSGSSLLSALWVLLRTARARALRIPIYSSAKRVASRFARPWVQ